MMLQQLVLLLMPQLELDISIAVFAIIPVTEDARIAVTATTTLAAQIVLLLLLMLLLLLVLLKQRIGPSHQSDCVVTVASG